MNIRAIPSKAFSAMSCAGLAVLTFPGVFWPLAGPAISIGGMIDTLFPSLLTPAASKEIRTLTKPLKENSFTNQFEGDAKKVAQFASLSLPLMGTAFLLRNMYILGRYHVQNIMR